MRLDRGHRFGGICGPGDVGVWAQLDQQWQLREHVGDCRLRLDGPFHGQTTIRQNVLDGHRLVGQLLIYQRQSVRIGDWKGIRQNLNPPGQQKKPELRTELYNLNEDEAEQRDVSAANPQMVARIECIMREQHTKSGLFPFPALDE